MVRLTVVKVRGSGLVRRVLSGATKIWIFGDFSALTELIERIPVPPGRCKPSGNCRSCGDHPQFKPARRLRHCGLLFGRRRTSFRFQRGWHSCFAPGSRAFNRAEQQNSLHLDAFQQQTIALTLSKNNFDFCICFLLNLCYCVYIPVAKAAALAAFKAGSKLRHWPPGTNS